LLLLLLLLNFLRRKSPKLGCTHRKHAHFSPM
jgi:hypothetical protein